MLDAVIAVITRGEKVLLIQRAANIRGGGHWAPVSGEVEPGESQEAAVAREAMEEVGLTVRPIRKVWENVFDAGNFYTALVDGGVRRRRIGAQCSRSERRPLAHG
jgi:8-oxo-dGTP diphosphatase